MPAALCGDPRQPHAGIERTRMTDRAQERDGLVAVAVAVAPGQIDVVFDGVRPDRRGLALAPQDRAAHPAGDHAILDGDRRAEHVVQVQVARQRGGLVSRRRGRQYDGVSHLSVRGHEFAGFRIDPAGDGRSEQPLTEVHEVLPGPHRLREQPGPFGGARPVVDAGDR